ncbi:MAG: hypothetical protein Q9N34_05850 [Aquificota bacterium]|nr:hypothetical protein [Aquificota bacterium]
MAQKGRRRGGPRYKRFLFLCPRGLYLVLNGIAMGDAKKLNRLIKGILEDKLQESTVAELEMLPQEGGGGGEGGKAHGGAGLT